MIRQDKVGLQLGCLFQVKMANAINAQRIDNILILCLHDADEVGHAEKHQRRKQDETEDEEDSAQVGNLGDKSQGDQHCRDGACEDTQTGYNSGGLCSRSL